MSHALRSFDLAFHDGCDSNLAWKTVQAPAGAQLWTWILGVAFQDAAIFEHVCPSAVHKVT